MTVPAIRARFSYQRNFTARLIMRRVVRYIAQLEVAYSPDGHFIAPPRGAAYWIVEGALVTLEREFDDAKKSGRRPTK